MRSLHKRLRFLRELCQTAALDRLHDHDFSAVPADHVIAGAGLHQFAVPVNRVQRDLHEFDLRVLRQHAVQQLSRGMERDAEMADLPVFLPLLRMIEQMRRLYDPALAVVAVIVDILDVVQQIIVDILHAQLVQLALEHVLDLIFRNKIEGREFCRHSEAVSRVAFDQSLAHSRFALAVVIDEAGIEISIACFQKSVNHRIELVIVKIGRDGLHRQSHHTKAKVFHSSLLIQARYSLLPKRAPSTLPCRPRRGSPEPDARTRNRQRRRASASRLPGY